MGRSAGRPLERRHGSPRRHRQLSSGRRAGPSDLSYQTISGARFRSLVQHSSDVVLVCEPDTTIGYQSPSTCDVLGHGSETLVGTRLSDLLHPDDRGVLVSVTAELLGRLEPGHAAVTSRWRQADGTWRPMASVVTNLLDDPDVAGLVLNSRDVTEQVGLEAELTRQAFTDSLTGLPNRALFADRVGHAVARAGITGPGFSIAVNVSARQLREPDLVTDVDRVLTRSGLAPSALLLEITESVLLQEDDVTMGSLQEFPRLGVRLAIDDFGTGYSSLSYLRHLPIDVLKIDKAFIDGVVDSTEAEAVVRTIVNLGEALHLETIAEGVEDLAQLDVLRSLGSTCAQGYHFSRPLPAHEMGQLLAAGGAAFPLAAPAAAI